MKVKVDKPIRIVGHWTFYVDRKSSLFNSVRLLMSDFASIKIRTPSLYAYHQDTGYSWNAFSHGVTADSILQRLKPLAKAAIPSLLTNELLALQKRYWRYAIEGTMTTAVCIENRFYTLRELVSKKRDLACNRQALLDNRTIHKTESEICGGDGFLVESLRGYQRDVVEKVTQTDRRSGVLVLPCGSGKTLIGIGILFTFQQPAVIFVPTPLAATQWVSELVKWVSSKIEILELEKGWYQVIDKTSKNWWAIGSWSFIPDCVRKLFHSVKIAVYDEVHSLPKSKFNDIELYCFPFRIGLTGSLTREDDGLLFIHNLIGPVRYCISCDEIYRQGYISIPQCVELKVPYEANRTKKPTIKEASENPMKIEVLKRLLDRHKKDAVLIFAAYNSQLDTISTSLGIPCLKGSQRADIGANIIKEFNAGKINILGLSKFRSSAIDLPRASIGIQLSGSFSSRNEEMQRIGRIMRSHPKNVHSIFYSLVSEGTVEEETSASRQMYMMEHGIPYVMGDSDELF